VTETSDLLTLTLLPGVGPRTGRDLLARGPLKTALEHPEEHADLLSGEACARLGAGQARREAEAQLDRAARLGVRIVGWDEPDYPERLRRIYDPPPVLFLRGTLAAREGERSLAVVGSRRASPQGLAVARTLARDLAAAGATIVSGLARGIDTSAHQGALEAGGRTVAVLGSGLDRLYPAENVELATAIAGSGAVVSEFPLGTEARPGHFPRRNRVIAGWGLGVVVVEAAQRSGALVTARSALDEGREVMAVPGHPSHPAAAGTNALIRDGARLVRHAEDVAAELGWPLAEATPEVGSDPVLRALRRDAPASLEEIEQRSGWSATALLGRLLELEVEEKIRRLPGALFLRN
jgi:DNA processing protein